MVSEKYRKKIRKMEALQALLVVLCIAAICTFLYIKLKPVEKRFTAKDECGPVGQMISHSIPDESTCANACGALCKSYELRYRSSSFVLSGLSCNQCDCVCT